MTDLVQISVTSQGMAMLMVAVDNLIVDYRKALRRAKRKKLPVMEAACEEAIQRYSKLFGRLG